MSNIVELSIAKAITAGLRKAMTDNDKVLVFGQDIAQLGGVFRVTEGLHAEFGQKRVFNSPIESALTPRATTRPSTATKPRLNTGRHATL